MRFSLINAVRNHPDRAYPLNEVYADYISDAVLAEELGFVRAWFGEHHFRPDQWTGSPIQVCTSVAARTTSLRLGTAVTCVPFHDPRRLAEDVAIADILSNGRFDFGIGPGSQYEEFKIFGVNSAEMTGRTFEAVDWIRQAYDSHEAFSHSGKYFDIPDMTFTTKPVQPEIPFWYGGMGPKNLARAAARGMNFIGPFNPGYDQALIDAGRNPADHQIAVMQMVCVADTTDKAWDIAGAGLEFFTNFYNLRKGLDGTPSPRPPITQASLRGGKNPMWNPAVGTPADVIKALTPFVDGTKGLITELALAFRHAGMRDEAQTSLRMFAEHVMPALHEIAAH